MASPTVAVRIVSKENYDQQYFFDLSLSSLPALPASSVRIRPRLLGLGSNNLAYCSAGQMLHWWSAFPVPSSLPSPYNDEEQYGIAPGWGLGEVLESTIQSLQAGTMLYGFMPLSAHPVDLELRQSDAIESHWLEISESRQKLMPLYKRYTFIEDPLSPANEVGSAYTSTLVWGAGYCLNRFSLASWPGDPTITPMPDFKLPWPKGSEDLKSALVVALGAGGKASRGFVQQLATNRAPASGPKGLLEVSSNTDSIMPSLKPGFDHHIVTYGNALSSGTLCWINSLNIERILICDFGSRDNIVEKLTLSLRDQLKGTKVDLITIGGESKVYTAEEKAARIFRNKLLQGTPMNTSGIREEAIKQLGEATFFEQYSSELQRVIETELARNKGTADEGKVLGVKLLWREGLRGINGLEQAWTDVAQGRVPGSEGLVFRI